MNMLDAHPTQDSESEIQQQKVIDKKKKEMN